MSAIKQEHLGEIILVEDGSPDNSLQVCKELTEAFDNVRLVQHPDGKNKGAGPTRNLGLSQARFPVVSFLDADDFYLPNRFSTAVPILHDNPEIDGVWEAVGTVYEGGVPQNANFKELTTINYPAAPADLFSILIRSGGPGHFQTNGITFRKSLLEKSGMFDDGLRLHQDTHLWVRMAYYGRLVAGRYDEPVAMRRLHGSNRITNSNYQSKQQLKVKQFQYFSTRDIDAGDYRALTRSYLYYHPERKHPGNKLSNAIDWARVAIKSTLNGEIQLQKLW